MSAPVIPVVLVVVLQGVCFAEPILLQRIRLVEAILLQLFRVAVKLRMARLEGAAAIGKVAAVADAAKPATAETSISTTVEEPAVTET